MKFSEIDENRWPELEPYLDTCLLPVTGLSGSEPPWSATKALEELRDLLDLVEIPFYGRVVTYPAFHYCGDRPEEEIRRIGANLRAAGFTYVIAACRDAPPALREHSREAVDLVLIAKDYEGMTAAARKAAIQERIVALWAESRGPAG